MQNSPLEFTISRENYDDKITPSIFSNPNLLQRLGKHNIHPVPKDKLGARVGIVNKEGTELLLKFKNEMANISALMPRAAEYKQSIQNSDQIKQTMVDVDLIALTGDYAECRGGITTAQNLPNNDKPALAHGGSRRNVYHRILSQCASIFSRIMRRALPMCPIVFLTSSPFRATSNSSSTIAIILKAIQLDHSSRSW